MMILYGDYKDLNYVCDYEDGRPSNVSVEEMEALRPYWEKFLNGKLCLKERRPTSEELISFVRIDIRHSVFTENEYTSYALMLPYGSDWTARQSIQATGCPVRCFTDPDAGIYITESEVIRNAKAPSSLAELKQREYRWEESFIRRIQATDGMGDIARGFQDDLAKWCCKESQRWFHKTAVSC